MAVVCLGAAGARAATLRVNTTADSSDSSCGSTCSLRDAITYASAGDTINFSVTGTITLSSALPAVTQSVTIAGPGASRLTISGAGSSQVFTTVGPGSSGPVAISGLAFINGKGSGNYGGVILQISGTLKVTDCSFSGNTASLNGGAIATYTTSTWIVSGSTFSGNSSTFGGGAIAAGGSSTIVNNTFSANSSKLGGAIYGWSGTQTVDNNLFSGNTATTAGAAIVQDSSTVTADHNVYYNNFVNGIAPAR